MVSRKRRRAEAGGNERERMMGEQHNENEGKRGKREKREKRP
jgi:hypothetical protein